jgi:hypothetical protein
VQAADPTESRATCGNDDGRGCTHDPMVKSSKGGQKAEGLRDRRTSAQGPECDNVSALRRAC